MTRDTRLLRSKAPAKGSIIEERAVDAEHEQSATLPHIPLKWRVLSVVLLCSISFGSAWSARLSSAMKSTIKKQLKINNTQFALLEASEDFMATALMLVSGWVTDRIGGAGAILYGNLIMTAGSFLIAGAAQSRSYQLMVIGRIVSALGDIATQIATYRVFSGWFAPSSGFASTLGLELGIGRIGGFVGTSTANIIAKRTSNFANVYWVAGGISIFTNICTILLFMMTKSMRNRFASPVDAATGETLSEKTKKLEYRKVLDLPWTFWAIMLFSMVQTSCSNVYSQNATELAEYRFNTDAIAAGWYAALSQYAGFFLCPIIGAVIDIYGHRISMIAFCGAGMLLCMGLLNWSSSMSGAAASYAVYAIVKNFGPVTIIDGIRTSMWEQNIFGSAYATKVTMNNASNIIMRIITGVLQDADNNSYRRVTVVYVFLATASCVVGISLLIASIWAADLQILQFTKAKRLQMGEFIDQRKQIFHSTHISRNKIIGKTCFIVLIMYVLGSWAAYFWGLATGNNA